MAGLSESCRAAVSGAGGLQLVLWLAGRLPLVWPGPRAERRHPGAALMGWPWCWARSPLWGCLGAGFPGHRQKPWGFLRSKLQTRGAVGWPRPQGRGDRPTSWWGVTTVPTFEGGLPPRVLARWCAVALGTGRRHPGGGRWVGAPTWQRAGRGRNADKGPRAWATARGSTRAPGALSGHSGYTDCLRNQEQGTSQAGPRAGAALGSGPCWLLLHGQRPAAGVLPHPCEAVGHLVEGRPLPRLPPPLPSQPGSSWPVSQTWFP